mmetsp:Transcript_13318/g.38272  ORF Transcript_13318/g.38272 Transcript_13318/m.38272 type:complete len:202 (-) Transcript_13318:1439-2044(-)
MFDELLPRQVLHSIVGLPCAAKLTVHVANKAATTTAHVSNSTATTTTTTPLFRRFLFRHDSFLFLFFLLLSLLLDGLEVVFCAQRVRRSSRDRVEMRSLQPGAANLFLHTQEHRFENSLRFPICCIAPVNRRRVRRACVVTHARPELPDLRLQTQRRGSQERPLPTRLDERRVSRDEGASQGEAQQRVPLDVLRVARSVIH